MEEQTWMWITVGVVTLVGIFFIWGWVSTSRFADRLLEESYFWHAEQLKFELEDEPPPKKFLIALAYAIPDRGVNSERFHELVRSTAELEMLYQWGEGASPHRMTRILSENAYDSEGFKSIMRLLGAWRYSDEKLWLYGYFGFDEDSGLWKNASVMGEAILAYRNGLLEEFSQELKRRKEADSKS